MILLPVALSIVGTAIEEAAKHGKTHIEAKAAESVRDYLDPPPPAPANTPCQERWAAYSRAVAAEKRDPRYRAEPPSACPLPMHVP